MGTVGRSHFTRMSDANQEELATAFHEAAHALAHLAMGYDVEIVSIEPLAADKLGGTLGRILPPELTPQKVAARELTPEHREALMDDITSFLAGDIAEGRFVGRPYRLDPWNANTSDEREAVGRLGALWPKYEEADSQLDVLHTRAERLVDAHWSQIETVARDLINSRTLTGDELRALLEWR